jgi:glycosyltransferase involved in cell wall biosynthesis
MKKISIVTPTYNTGEFIERTILSVKNQGYPEYEHIIVDAGSKDATAEIAGKYPSLNYVIEPGCTQSEALNIGFRMVSGGIVGWINSDDVYNPGAFRKVSDFMDAHPQVDMVYSDCRFINENDKEIGIWRTAPFSYFRNLNYAQMVPQQTIFFRREVFEKVGFINEKYNYAMDYDFIVRVSKECRVARMPGEALASFRLHGVSKTVSQRGKFEPEVLEIRRKHGAIVPYGLFKVAHAAIGLFKKRL